MNKKDLEQWAKTFKRDLDGPLGPLPMEQVIRRHIATFSDLRAAGATWPQIANLMSKAGVLSKNSNVIQPSQWRATVSRVLKTNPPQELTAPPSPPPSPAPTLTPSPAPPKAHTKPIHAPSKNRGAGSASEKIKRAQKLRKVVKRK